MWPRFIAHTMILWRTTLLFWVQIYGNGLCFPAAGNAVKAKLSCILNSWRRTEKWCLRVSYCKILLTSKSQAFFINKPTNRNQWTKPTEQDSDQTFLTAWEMGSVALQTDLQEMPFVCSLRKEKRHLSNTGLPIRNVRCTSFLIVAKCSLVQNGHFEFYGKFSP